MSPFDAFTTWALLIRFFRSAQIEFRGEKVLVRPLCARWQRTSTLSGEVSLTGVRINTKGQAIGTEEPFDAQEISNVHDIGTLHGKRGRVVETADALSGAKVVRVELSEPF